MDSSFAANELGQFPCGLFLAPTFRTIFLLDSIESVEMYPPHRAHVFPLVAGI